MSDRDWQTIARLEKERIALLEQIAELKEAIRLLVDDREELVRTAERMVEQLEKSK